MTETYVLKRGRRAYNGITDAQIDTSVNPIIANSDYTYNFNS